MLVIYSTALLYSRPTVSNAVLVRLELITVAIMKIRTMYLSTRFQYKTFRKKELMTFLLLAFCTYSVELIATHPARGMKSMIWYDSFMEGLISSEM